MAKIGLRYPVFAIGTETTSAITYASGAILAKAISANIKIDTSDIKLYSDDVISETDRSFVGGTITLDADDLSDAVRIALLGYAEGSEIDAVTHAKELSSNSGTTPATVGVGFYGKRRKSGVDTWRAIWLKKVQFAEPTDDYSTKGESVEFKTPTLEGIVMVCADGKWKEEGTFSTEAGAIAWLNGKSGISAAASNNITALAFAGGTLTPAFAAGTYNYSNVATGNLTPTATFAAGTAKVYVDGVYNQLLATTVAGSAITIGAGSSHIIQIVVQESGKSAITYTVLVTRA